MVGDPALVEKPTCISHSEQLRKHAALKNPIVSTNRKT